MPIIYPLKLGYLVTRAPFSSSFMAVQAVRLADVMGLPYPPMPCKIKTAAANHSWSAWLYLAENLMIMPERQQHAASIITIGDELLIGRVIDTNSAWMAQELNKNGIAVKRRVAVGDSWDEIWKALDEESLHASIIPDHRWPWTYGLMTSPNHCFAGILTENDRKPGCAG